MSLSVAGSLSRKDSVAVHPKSVVDFALGSKSGSRRAGGRPTEEPALSEANGPQGANSFAGRKVLMHPSVADCSLVDNTLDFSIIAPYPFYEPNKGPANWAYSPSLGLGKPFRGIWHFREA